MQDAIASTHPPGFLLNESTYSFVIISKAGDELSFDVYKLIVRDSVD